MAESVDALVSNTSRFTPVPVRPRLWVLERETRVSLFFLSVLSGERVQHAVHRVCFVGCWQASLLRPTKHTQATPPLATLSLPTSAVLTLIGGCANREVFIARPCGLRSMVFALVLRTSTRLWVQQTLVEQLLLGFLIFKNSKMVTIGHHTAKATIFIYVYTLSART